MDKDGYVLDYELAKIYGKEPNFCTAEIYKRQWSKLNADKEYFADKKIIEKEHHKGKYLVRFEGLEENQFMKVGRDFYLTLMT